MASREARYNWVNETSLWVITDGHTVSTHTPHICKNQTHTPTNVSCVQTPTCTHVLYTQTHI